MRYTIQFIFFLLLLPGTCFTQDESSEKAKFDVFTFEKEVILPGTPEVIFDAVTGDISGWWDHHM
ncbi:MAG TPA: hypothetical protein VIY47_06805 [Ignavibacteriaceae bacterium]